MRTHKIEPRRAKTNPAALPPRTGRLLAPLFAGGALLFTLAAFAQKPAPPPQPTPPPAPKKTKAEGGGRTEDENRKELVERWHEMVDVKFNDVKTSEDYANMAAEAKQMHLSLGDFPLGRVQYTDSSSYFHGTDLVPRLLAAYCDWKAAQTSLDGLAKNNLLVEAESLIYPMLGKTRYPMYQMPSVVAVYLDCALATQPTSAHTMDTLRLLYAGMKKYPDSRSELSVLCAKGQGVPLLLGSRLVRDEPAALESIRKRFNEPPKFTFSETDAAALITSGAGRQPVALGRIAYPLPVDIEAVDDGGARLGPMAPGVTGAFAITLDTPAQELAGLIKYRWRIHAIEPFLAEFLTKKAPLSGKAVTAPLSGEFVPPDDAQRHYRFAEPLLDAAEAAPHKPFAFLTDLGSERVWTVAQSPAFTIATTNAPRIGWQLVNKSGGAAYPAQEQIMPTEKGMARIEIPAGILDQGRYELRVRVPGISDWTTAKDAPGFAIVSDKAAAFVVGIDYYGGGESDLTHSCHDAEAFRQTLMERFGYNAENIGYLLGKAGAPGQQTVETRAGSVNGYVTAETIRDEFNRFMRMADERNITQIVLYFTGHGATIENQECFLTANQGFIPIKQIITQLAVGAEKTVGKKRQIVSFIDACRKTQSGEAVPFRPQDIKLYDNATVYFPVLSCAENQLSNENADADSDTPPAIKYPAGVPFEHAFFTWALLRAMQEVSQGGKKASEIPIAELLNHIFANLNKINDLAMAANAKIPSKDDQYALPQNIEADGKTIAKTKDIRVKNVKLAVNPKMQKKDAPPLPR